MSLEKNKSLQENNNPETLFFSAKESDSSFDFLAFLLKILKYWYLFVACAAVAIGLAWIENKSWTPTYRTTTTILIEDSRSNLRNDFTSGYGSYHSGRNMTNQMILYKSSDLVLKAIDSLHVTSDIYEKGRFKNRMLYKRSPVVIDPTYVSGQLYGCELRIQGLTDDTYLISFEGNKQIAAFSVEGVYGQDIQHSLFFVNLSKTDYFVNPIFDFHFKFLSKASLASSYGGRLSLRVVGENSSVLEVALIGKIAERDVDFLNILNAKFFDQNLARKNDIAEKSIQFLGDQIRIMKDSIDVSEQKLSSYQQQTGMYTPEISTTKQREIEEIAAKRESLKLRKDYIQFLSDGISKSSDVLQDPAASGVHNPMLSNLVVQYNDISRKNRNLGETSPIYRQNQSTQADLKKSIEENLVTMRKTIALEENQLNDQERKTRGQLAVLPQQERKLMSHERNFEINNTYYNYLLQRRTESQIQKASNAPDNLIIDKPRTVGITNMEERRNNYMVFTLIGLLIPLIFVACREFLFKVAIQSREEVEKITRYPLLATIERSKKREDMAVKMHPRSSFAEGFRNLRSRMEYIVQKQDQVSMLVTSTEPKDGKTFIALNLASIYEIAKKKVVVIDFDLRRPALSKALGLENNVGLTSYLIGQATIDDILVRNEKLGFDVIPAGAIPPNPSELIRSDKTNELLKDLYEKYDYVILDCSPVGLVSDAHYLARLVDVVLFVVRNDKTNKNFLKYTIKELREDGVTNLAIVYNDVDIKHGYYGNRRYYGKSSYYLKHGNYYHND